MRTKQKNKDMSEIEKALKHLKRTVSQLKYLDNYEPLPWEKEYVKERNAKNLRRLQACRVAIEAIEEKRERESRMQWIDDMHNPLEPIKVEAALQSEILKFEYRKEHSPKDVSSLDYTIICALDKVLRDSLEKEH